MTQGQDVTYNNNLFSTPSFLQGFGFWEGERWIKVPELKTIHKRHKQVANKMKQKGHDNMSKLKLKGLIRIHGNKKRTMKILNSIYKDDNRSFALQMLEKTKGERIESYKRL